MPPHVACCKPQADAGTTSLTWVAPRTIVRRMITRARTSRPLPRLAGLAIALLLSLAACQENRDPATADGTLHVFRDAVMKKDGPAILGHCTAATLAQLKELHAVVRAQSQVIQSEYPAEHKVAAKAAYPPGVLEAETPEALFAALMDRGLAELDTSEGLGAGLIATAVTQSDADHASVQTRAGEAIDFAREGGVWKTTVFEKELKARLAQATQFQQTLTENLKVVAELNRLQQLRQGKPGEAPSPSSAP